MAATNNKGAEIPPLFTTPLHDPQENGMSVGKSTRWNYFKTIAGDPVQQGPAKITSLDYQSAIPAVMTLGSNLVIYAVLKNLEKRTLRKVNEENKRTNDLANVLRERGDDMTAEQFAEQLAELAKLRRKNELRASDGTKQFIKNESEKYLTGAGLFFVVAIFFPPAAFVGLGIVGLGAAVIGTKCALQAEQDRRDVKGVKEHVLKQAKEALAVSDITDALDKSTDGELKQKDVGGDFKERSSASSRIPDSTPVVRSALRGGGKGR